MAASPTRRGDSMFSRGAALIPAVTALSVGALYVLGGLFRAAELSHAGYSVRDTLPLVPLSQLLTRGVAVVWDNLGGILASVIGLSIMTLFSHSLEAHGSAVDTATASFERWVKKSDAADPDAATEALLEERSALEADFAAVKAGTATSDQTQRVADWSDRIHALLAKEKESAAELNDIRTGIKGRGPGRLLDRVSAWPRPVAVPIIVLGAAILIGSVLASTVPYAIGLWAPLLAWLVAGRFGRGWPLYPHHASLVIVSIIVAELIAAAVAPLPLSQIRLVEQDGRTVSGKLIASTSDWWYVGGGHGRLIAIRAADAVNVAVLPAQRRRVRHIYQYIW